MSISNVHYHKVCIDQSVWDNDHPNRWSFGNGQNLSIILLADTKQRLNYDPSTHILFDRKAIFGSTNVYGSCSIGQCQMCLEYDSIRFGSISIQSSQYGSKTNGTILAIDIERS